MSDFSDLLSKYIQEKNIQVASMVKYCGIDRSAMYKIIKGKHHPPTVQIRDKMARFMHLTPEENRLFNRAYEISQIGKDTYFRRKEAEKFILNFPSALKVPVSANAFSPGSAPEKPISLPDSPCISFSRHELFHYYVQNIVEAEMQTENGKIGLLLQPDCEFLFSYLTNLNFFSSGLSIEHILCMDYTEKTDTYCNIRNLSAILPLFMNGINYQVSFFYNDVHSHYRSLNVFPSMILTSKYAITCTSDYKNGILHQDPAAVSMLWELFSSYKEKCRPLFQIPHSIEEAGNMVTATTLSNSRLYYMEPEPCLIPFLERDWVAHFVPEDFPGRDNIIAYMQAYVKSAGQVIRKSEFHFYFCRDELDKFAETGILAELPQELSHTYTLSVEERITVLENLLKQKSRAHYRFLKPPFEQIAKRLHLCAGENNMYLMFFDIMSHRSYLWIQESEIIHTLYDYLGSLDSEALYSEEETLEYFRRTIEHLKQSIKEASHCD